MNAVGLVVTAVEDGTCSEGGSGGKGALVVTSATVMVPVLPFLDERAEGYEAMRAAGGEREEASGTRADATTDAEGAGAGGRGRGGKAAAGAEEQWREQLAHTPPQLRAETMAARLVVGLGGSRRWHNCADAVSPSDPKAKRKVHASQVRILRVPSRFFCRCGCGDWMVLFVLERRRSDGSCACLNFAVCRFQGAWLWTACALLCSPSRATPSSSTRWLSRSCSLLFFLSPLPSFLSLLP